MLDINTADKARKIKNFKPVFEQLAQWPAKKETLPDELNGPRAYQTKNAVDCDDLFTGFQFCDCFYDAWVNNFSRFPPCIVGGVTGWKISNG